VDLAGSERLGKTGVRSFLFSLLQFCLSLEARSSNAYNFQFCHSTFCLLLQSEGQVQMEAMYINKSLSFLEQVILALADSRREHVPFRQCKLTHALKDSLG